MESEGPVPLLDEGGLRAIRKTVRRAALAAAVVLVTAMAVAVALSGPDADFFGRADAEAQVQRMLTDARGEVSGMSCDQTFGPNWLCSFSVGDLRCAASVSEDVGFNAPPARCDPGNVIPWGE